MSKRQRRRRAKRRRHEPVGPGRRRVVAGAGLSLGVALGMSSTAQADVETFTVDSAADPGDANCATNGCTLREAIGLANDVDPSGEVDTIVFHASITGSVTLTAGVLGVHDALTITGPGAATLAIDGANATRIFNMSPPSGEDVSLSGLTIRNANGPDMTAGGAIYNGADLTITDSVLTGSSGDSGGGIASGSGSSLTLQRTTVSGNTADHPMGGTSGGLYIASGSDLTIDNSTISGNMATGMFGAYGGVRVSLTPATIRNSTISGNSATSIDGGVSIVQGSGHPVSIQNSTIAGNQATNSGGGLSRLGFGGMPAETTLSNTLVADNAAATGPDVYGAVNAGFSLIENTAGATINHSPAGSNVTGQDPLLEPLANNGGPTMTHGFLYQTSPALDRGLTAGAATTDQRGAGFPRPFDLPSIANAMGGDGADIGAFEAQTLPPAPPSPPPPPAPTPMAPGALPSPTPTVTRKKKKCKKRKKSRLAAAAKKCKRRK